MISINGSPLELGFVGQGVYTRRLIMLLADAFGPEAIRVLDPGGLALPKNDPLERFVCPVPRGRPMGPKLLNGLRTGIQISRFASRQSRNDIFLSPSPIVGPIPRRSIVVLHDVIYRRFTRYEGKFIVRKLINRLAEATAARAASVVTISNFSQQEILTYTNVPSEKLTVIPNWIDDKFARAAKEADLDAVRRKYGLPPRYWLYVGGYDYRKNVEFLIDAFAKVSSAVACPTLVLAGKIPGDISKPVCDVHGAIRRAAVPPGKIHLPGFIEEADLPGVYAGAELHVFPSLMEGYGYSAAESLACGCPCIAADNSGLREVILDRDYRFPTHSSSELETMLARAASIKLPLNPSLPDFDPQRARRQFTSLFNSLC